MRTAVHNFSECRLLSLVIHRIVGAFFEHKHRNALITSGELRIRVNQRLRRRDLTSANIRAALEQIPCTLIRQTVLRELDQGALHPKEEQVLVELFAALEHDDAMNKGMVGRSFSALDVPIKNQVQEPAKERKNAEERETGAVHNDAENVANVSGVEKEPSCGNSEGCEHREKLIRYGERVAAAGLQAIREEPDDEIIQKIQTDSAQQLLTPHVPIAEIPEAVVHMVMSSAMYYSNASFSRIGQWFGGKAKSTMYNWVIGLAFALWPVIQGWLWQHVNATRVYIDETWLKIRKKWH